MPIFEFECSKCKKIRDILTKYECNATTCDSCGAPSHRIISAPRGIVRGSNNPVPGQFKHLAARR